MYTERFTEGFELLAHIPADSETTEVNSGFVSLADYPRVVVLISVGDLAATATFDVDIEEGQGSAGSNPQNLTGKSITQLTASDDDVAIAIEIRAEELTVNSGYNHINVECTPANAAVEFSVMVFGFVARQKPVPVTAWEEIVD